MFRLSGKDYNDLGRYEDCTNLSNFNYILASVPHVFPIPMALGLCVPSACSATDMASFKPYIISAINDVIPEVFEGIKGFNPNT